MNVENGRVPIYLDNACMTLKPVQVLKEMERYYTEHPSCHNRASHEFGTLTTQKVDSSRVLINKYLNCRKEESIIFTRNTTESINMVASLVNFNKNDIILTTDLEHNSNMLPWQFLSIRNGVRYKQVPISPFDDEFDLHSFENILAQGQVKLVSLFHISNITGMELPVKEIVTLAHRYGALVLLDAAQSLSHKKLDVQELDVDFLVCSFHKAFGPTGMGLLYSKKGLLDDSIPYLIGGESVTDSTFDSCTLKAFPERFEAGLQNYAGILGSGAAISYLKGLDLVGGADYVQGLNAYLTERLRSINGLSVIGPPNVKHRSGIINISTTNIRAQEYSVMLSKSCGIMTRDGVHCGHAWYHKYNLMPSLRISLSFYNTLEELDSLVENLTSLAKL